MRTNSGNERPAAWSLRALAQDNGGGTAIEYALIAGGIGLVIAVTVPGVGTALNNFFTGLAGSF